MWSRAGTDITSDPKNQQSTITFTEGYQVVHDVGATEYEILSAPGLPSVGDPFREMPTSFAKSVKKKQVGPILSEVTVIYEGQSGGSGRPGTGLFADPQIELTDVTTSVPVDTDLYDNPIINVNGEPLNGVQREFSDQVLVVTRNYSYWNSYVQSIYRQAVNSDEFFGWPPGTAKVVGLNANLVRRTPEDGGLGYWRVQARIQFRIPYRTVPAKAWYARIRHDGYLERIDDSVEVTLTGPDGTGALATACVVKGQISAIHVIDGGSGYQNPPDVSITSASGSGATATAVISGGSVIAIVVNEPGSGYGEGTARAVDGNKQPIGKPVVLNRFGKHTGEVCWLEIPLYPALPFSALGLL